MKLSKKICQMMETAAQAGEISDADAVQLLNLIADAAKGAPGEDESGEDEFLELMRGYGERNKRK